MPLEYSFRRRSDVGFNELCLTKVVDHPDALLSLGKSIKMVVSHEHLSITTIKKHLLQVMVCNLITLKLCERW